MARHILKGSPELMQKLNTSLVLDIIKESGPISRTELAKRTRLSNPAVSTLIAPLIEEGIVQEIGTAESTGGRPARLLRFNAKSGYLVGVDVGGTTMFGAVVDMGGNILSRKILPSSKGEESLNTLVSLIEELIQGVNQPKANFRGIGLGIPGITADNGQQVSFAPGIGWEDLDIGGLLSNRFAVPLFADNDVNCFARGELWRGALKGITNGVAVTIGTGIGVGIIIDSHVYRGSGSAAGEVGYWLLGSLGPIEKSKGYGPLESIAAGPGIAKQAIAELSQNPQSGRILRDLVNNNIAQITAKEVFAAAKIGDDFCKRLVEQTSTYLGILMANMASLLNMEKIVIGGGISGAKEQLLAPIRHVVEQLTPYPPQIEISVLQEDAAVLGAVSGVLGMRESSIQFSQLDWED